MTHAPRQSPLRAEPDRATSSEPPHGDRRRWRSVLLGIGIGGGVGVAAVAIAFSIVAIPLFIVASTEPGSGLNRDLVRTGLFKVALPFGSLTGVAVGVAVGIWYARGGRLPRDRTPLEL